MTHAPKPHPQSTQPPDAFTDVTRVESAISDFQDNLSKASFHYADDSCKEWGQAKVLQEQAKMIRHMLAQEFAETDPAMHDYITARLDGISNRMLCSA